MSPRSNRRKRTPLKPFPSPWQSLLEPFKAGEWHECADILRPHVDQHPDELASRMLLAAIYQRLENPGLAQVQLERALPLAVGQGDLFRAIGVQKQIDVIRARTRLHRQRYIAIHQWFGSLSRTQAQPASAALTPRALLALAPREFDEIAIACVLEDLGLEPREIACDAETARVILYGRVRWTEAPSPDRAATELIAEAHELIASGTDETPGTSLKLECDLPSACLRFDLSLLRRVQSRATSAAGAAGGREPRKQRSKTAPANSTEPATAPPERPRPDPVAEPVIAVGAPIERRRGTRVTATLETRVALLGISGTRVAPFGGRLLDLSPSGMGVGFPRGEIRHIREELEGALLDVELKLDRRGEPLELTCRVRWVSFDGPDGAAEPDELARLGLEFVLLTARARTRIQDALIRATHSGKPLGSELEGKELDGGKQAA
jgi:hypothetical protein